MSFILRALVWFWYVLMLVLVEKSFVLKHIMAFSLRHNEMNHTCCWCYYEFFIELNMALSWKACRWFSIARKYTFSYCKQHMYNVHWSVAHCANIFVKSTFDLGARRWNTIKHWNFFPSLFHHIFHFLLLLLLLFQLWIQYVKRDDNS